MAIRSTIFETNGETPLRCSDALRNGCFESRLVSTSHMGSPENSESFTSNRVFVQTFKKLKEATIENPSSKVTPVPPCVHPVPGRDIPQSSGSSSTPYKVQLAPLLSLAEERNRNVQENQDILSKDACPSNKKKDAADEEVEDESSYGGMHVMCRTAHQQMSANIMKKAKEVWEKRQNRR